MTRLHVWPLYLLFLLSMLVNYWQSRQIQHLAETLTTSGAGPSEPCSERSQYAT